MHLLVRLLAFIPLVAPQCYYPDGSTAANNFPCDPSANNSVCCLSGTICTDNGICMDLGAGDSEWNRGSCTDKSWNAPECPTFCKEADTSNFVGMSSCGNNGAFVCQSNSSACSNAANQVSIGIPVPYAIPSSGGASRITPAGILVTSSASGSALPVTTTPLSGSAAGITNAPYSTQTASPVPSSESGLSEGGKIGVGVGVSLGVLFLGAAAFAGFFLGRRNSRNAQAVGGNQYQGYGYHEMRNAPGYQAEGIDAGRSGVSGGVPPQKPAAVPGFVYGEPRAEAGSEQRMELGGEGRGELQG